MKKIKIILLIIMLSHPMILFAQNLTDYLIDTEIGEYKKSYDCSCTDGAGVVNAANHFKTDHRDYSCDVRYYKRAVRLGVEVEVTQHAGGDSDRWLLHELDRNFRNYYGIPSDSYAMRIINGNTIMAVRTGGGKYQWLSGNKVIHISYTDLQLTKQEPLEIVQAYLNKHPSSLTNITSADLRTSENKSKWIKDEMTRRLWLCDKWQYQAGSITQADLLPKLLESMIVFLNYRQKYFNISAEDERNTLRSYLENSNTDGFQTKLTEYKTWWSANKGKSITLP